MAKDIYDINLLDLVPYSIKGDKQVQAISAAVSPQLQEVSQEIKYCIILARLDELEEPIVDLLAWQFHVDFYEPDLPIEQKRGLVRTSIEAHRHKGTPYAVKQVVSAILKDAKVEEWFEYGGEPYRFRVVKIGGQMPDLAIYERLKRAINTAKNTRSWLDGISLERQIKGNIYLGMAKGIYKRIAIYPIEFRAPEILANQYYGVITSVFKRIEI